jgi:hypothetical protein
MRHVDEVAALVALKKRADFGRKQFLILKRRDLGLA